MELFSLILHSLENIDLLQLKHCTSPHEIPWLENCTRQSKGGVPTFSKWNILTCCSETNSSWDSPSFHFRRQKDLCHLIPKFLATLSLNQTKKEKFAHLCIGCSCHLSASPFHSTSYYTFSLNAVLQWWVPQMNFHMLKKDFPLCLPTKSLPWTSKLVSSVYLNKLQACNDAHSSQGSQ